MRNVLFITALALIAATSASLGNPYPGGTCVIPDLDDGVATARNPPPPKGGLQDHRFIADDPRVISMKLPSGGAGALDFDSGTIVVDIRFSIKSDGTASEPAVLCARPQATPLGAQLLSSAPEWRFVPMKLNGTAIDSVATYRIVVDVRPPSVKRFPLAFMPD